MSCRKMNEDLKNLLPESFQNLEEFQLENLIKFLNTNLGESFLSDQIITVFDISSLKALTEDKIRPGH